MIEKATFAGGCFWCTEAIFKMLRGVIRVTSGFSGGKSINPGYGDVISEENGHAETVQIEFDPSQINYSDLLYVFLKTHDPTSRDRQGYDIGTMYRSIIFYHNAKQKKEAESAIKNLQKELKGKIVTELKEYEIFYPAEDYHQDFYNKHRFQPYCMLVIDPKIQKLKTHFSKYLK